MPSHRAWKAHQSPLVVDSHRSRRYFYTLLFPLLVALLSIVTYAWLHVAVDDAKDDFINSINKRIKTRLEALPDGLLTATTMERTDDGNAQCVFLADKKLWEIYSKGIAYVIMVREVTRCTFVIVLYDKMAGSMGSDIAFDMTVQFLEGSDHDPRFHDYLSKTLIAREIDFLSVKQVLLLGTVIKPGEEGAMAEEDNRDEL